MNGRIQSATFVFYMQLVIYQLLNYQCYILILYTYRFLFIFIVMTFSIDRETLAKFAAKYQTRTFAEQVDALEEHGQNLDWMLTALSSDRIKGISDESADIAARKQAFGTNQKYVKQPPGFCQLFCDALEDFTLRILIVASIVSIAIEVGTADGEHRKTAWIEGAAVMLAVMISATVTAINDYQKQRQFQKLNQQTQSRKIVTIKRNGKIANVHQDLVLVGDIVNINEGMEIPADGLLIEANQITTDQSAMTGEAHHIKKNTVPFCIKKKKIIEANGQKNQAGKDQISSPIMMSGTKVLTGEGKMVVIVVGDMSCNGKIRAALDQQEIGATPLQMKLQKIAEDIGKFGLYSAIIILIVLLIRFAIQKGISREWKTATDLPELLNFFILAITVIVVAIPEGLPLAVTLSLAFSVKKMLIDQNLVRKMQACETMGGANNICSDKTGTLTKNQMTLTTVWCGKAMKVDTYSENIKIEEQVSKNNKFIELFRLNTCVNGAAELEPEEKGSSTEIAILKFIRRCGIDYRAVREQNPTFLKYPFSSARKRMSVILDHNGEQIILVKGASQMVMASCSDWFNPESGEVETITAAMKQEMQKAIVAMASKSLRTLCLAYKHIRPTSDLQTKDDKGVFQIQKQQLICLCIIGVKDVPREEVPDAIQKCKIAGITIRMVTGDNLITAKAIAEEIGIIQPGDGSVVMEGTDFIKKIGGVVCKLCKVPKCDCARDLKEKEKTGKQLRVDTIQNGEEFDKLKDTLRVLARSRPEDKYALVTGLRERGEVVAVTGDGTNDAPALKKADVGFAMGITGTEVAKQAADIILLNDNFTSIVKAVLWGRNIYDSIRKFIQFQLTVNVVAVCITLVGAGLIKQQILKPIQMLWINLIMDTLASLALATEPPTEQLLNRHPHSRNQYIISKTMFKHILGQAVYQLAVMLVLVFLADRFIPEYPGRYDTTQFLGRLEYKYKDGIVGGTVRSGRFNHLNGQKDYKVIYEELHIYSRHFTFIFNTFVMMQMFNFLNCRKLHQQKNIFEGITRNTIFLIIVAVIFSLQILLITFGSIAFGVYSDYGLTIQQWLICIGIGSISLIVNFILKMIPIKEDQHQDDKGEEPKIADPLVGSKEVNLKRSHKRIQTQLSRNVIG